jgi:hypothetical protein
MINKFGKTIKLNSNKLFLRIRSKTRKNIIKKFADKFGLVYFGYVNQHDDDHKIIRGLTVSTRHVDHHYCVGSVGTYNVAVVDRSDIIQKPNASIKLKNWFIVSFDLHTKKPVPHFFIQSNNRDDKLYEALFTIFPNMKQVYFGTFEKYSPDFISRFSIYARPAKSVDVEKLINSKASLTLGAHLWPYCVEQHNNVLYVYSSNNKLSIGALETMLENGLWLASFIDSQVEKD